MDFMKMLTFYEWNIKTRFKILFVNIVINFWWNVLIEERTFWSLEIIYDFIFVYLIPNHKPSYQHKWKD